MSTEEMMFELFPELECKRLFLRRMVENDVGEYYEMASNPEVAEHQDWDICRNIDDAKKRMEMVNTAFDHKRAIYWAIIEKSSQKFIGYIALKIPPYNTKKGELAYSLNRDYWGLGFASEAANAVIAFGFDGVGLRRIEAITTLKNTASIKMLERLGFLLEGVLRQYYYWKNEFHDMCMYARINS